MCDLCNMKAEAVAEKAPPRVNASGPAKAPPKTKWPKARSHGWYIEQVAAAVIRQPDITKAERKAMQAAKLAYGWGEAGTRGVTVKGWWQHADGKVGDLVGVNCGWQRSTIELVETIAHELGHVAAGVDAGHGPEWKAACARLGFPAARAVDTSGDGSLNWAWFTPRLAKAVKRIPLPNDGGPLDPTKRKVDGKGKAEPTWSSNSPSAVPDKPRACGAGWGTQGGQSRGKGAGSRQLLYHCSCKPRPVKVRHAGFDLDATCNRCKAPFVLVEASVPTSSTWGTGMRPDGDGGAVPSHGGVRVAGTTKRKAKAQGNPLERVNDPLPAAKPIVGDIPF